MLDFTKLWNTIYLFGLPAGGLSRSDYIFFGISVFFILLSAACKFWAVKAGKVSPGNFLYSRYYHLFLTMGLLLLLWAGARFESIPWLSTHFLGLILLVISAIWFIFILKYHIREHGSREKVWQEEEVRKKYLSR